MPDYGAAYKYESCIYTTEPIKHTAQFKARMEDFGEVCRAARAAGMSYGQYVARMAAQYPAPTPAPAPPKERKKPSAKRCTYGVFKDGKLIKECSGGEELAEFLGVARNNVYGLVKAGRCGDYDLVKLKGRPRIGAVLQLDEEGQAVARWESASAAAEYFGVCSKYIQWAAHNREKARGWRWAYD